MNIRAKQLLSLDTTKMDITSALGFFGQIKDIILTCSPLVTNLQSVWTTYVAALQAFDVAYAQSKKWEQTADIEELDKQRDSALSAFLNALKAMLASPNASKAAAAKTLTFIRDKYSLSTSDEYMKETTAISQMVQEMESVAANELATTGLDDWLTDLKQKNDAFLAKMNERTEAQAGMQKGIVREKRLACESAYRDLVKLINALAIVEYPSDYNYNSIIDHLNAEIEHYRQILARKGVSSGGSSDNGGGDNGGGDNPDNGGGDNGGDDNGGGDNPTPQPDPQPDPNPNPQPDPDDNGGGSADE